MQLKALTSAALLAGAQAFVAPGASKPALALRAEEVEAAPVEVAPVAEAAPEAEVVAPVAEVAAVAPEPVLTTPSVRSTRAPPRAWDIALDMPAGISAPFGYFDPAGLGKKVSEQRAKYFRECELKHGRVAMLAAFGFPIAEHFHPLFGGNIDVPSCVEINQCVGCTDNSSLSHFSAMTRPSWLGRAARNRHRHAIEQASRRWRGGRRDDSARTRRKILISAQVPSYVAYQQTPLQTFWPVVLLYVGIVEIFSVFTFENPFGKGGFWTLKDDRVPGDFGWDPMDMYPTVPPARTRCRRRNSQQWASRDDRDRGHGRPGAQAAGGDAVQQHSRGLREVQTNRRCFTQSSRRVSLQCLTPIISLDTIVVSTLRIAPMPLNGSLVVECAVVVVRRCVHRPRLHTHTRAESFARLLTSRAPRRRSRPCR